MKPTALATPQTSAVPAVKARLRDYAELLKLRLSALSVMTALFGYFAAVPAFSWTVVVALMVGSSLAAGGAAAINQVMEREEDALMRRTSARPLPAGKLSSAEALALGLGSSLLGSVVLFAVCGWLAGTLAAMTVGIYALLYTPMKKRSEFATEIGAIAGALPPLIGWAAAGTSSLFVGYYLFAILFIWQIPHFMSISWLYREDYARGGFAMLAIHDDTGDLVARRALLYSILLCVVAPLPAVTGEATWLYGILALAVSLWMAAGGRRFKYPERRREAARTLFLRTLAYLPVLLLLFALDRLFFLV